VPAAKTIEVPPQALTAITLYVKEQSVNPMVHHARILAEEGKNR
jgi:hypothetical protein